MALNKGQVSVVETLVTELEIAQTWVSGPRAAKLGGIAKALSELAKGDTPDVETSLAARTVAPGDTAGSVPDPQVEAKRLQGESDDKTGSKPK